MKFERIIKVRPLFILALAASVAALSFFMAPSGFSSSSTTSERSAPRPAPQDNFCGWETGGACSTDADCKITGCSGEVCQSVSEAEYATICDWKDCYEPKSYGMGCGCVNGGCQWNREFHIR